MIDLPIATSRCLLAFAVAFFLCACTKDDISDIVEEHSYSYGHPDRIQETPTVTTPTQVLIAHRQIGGLEDFAQINFIQPIDKMRLLVGDELAVPHLSVVDISTGNIEARIGKHGNGPLEFMSPGRSTRDPIDDSIWWVFDYDNIRWTAIALDNHPRIIEQIRLSRLPMWPETPIWMDDDEALVHGIFYGFPFVKISIDRKHRRIESFRRFTGPQPFSQKTIDHGTGLRMVNRSFMAVRPSKDLFVVAYQFGNQIDIFSTNGAIVTKTRGPHDVTASFRIVDDRFYWNEDNQSGYVEAFGTQRFFYLRWSGRRLDGPLNTTTELHQFDWHGRLRQTFKLDQAVLAFAVSSTDDRLWGYVEDLHPLLLEWDVPPIEDTSAPRPGRTEPVAVRRDRATCPGGCPTPAAFTSC